MAKRKHLGASSADLAFDMTPMIDVTFQLIIFFMLNLSFSQSQTAARLTLPVADQARPPEQSELELFVFNVVNLNARDVEGAFVFPQGTPPFVLGGRYMDLVNLRRELDKAATVSRARHEGEAKKDLQAAVIIRGDRDAAWQNVIAGMQQCQMAGFVKVYLKALEAEESAPRK